MEECLERKYFFSLKFVFERNWHSGDFLCLPLKFPQNPANSPRMEEQF